VTVTFVIDEGTRYKIRNVSVVGNTKYTSDQLLAELKLTNDEYFNQAKMTKDVNALQDKYGGIGYVFADVKADPRFLEEAGQLDLVYNIKEGDRLPRRPDQHRHQGRVSAHANHHGATPPLFASGRYRRHPQDSRQ